MTTEERLETLEREMAAMREKITTKELVIVDENGKLRAALSTAGAGALPLSRLDLCDECGEARAQLSVGILGSQL